MVGVGGHGDMSNDYAVVYAYFGSKTNWVWVYLG
jgi:hypothetical protein